jgi:hypothetical protein
MDRAPLYFQLSKLYFLAAQRLLDRRIDFTPETVLLPNDNCLHVLALAAKWPIMRSCRTEIEHQATSKSAIYESIRAPNSLQPREQGIRTSQLLLDCDGQAGRWVVMHAGVPPVSIAKKRYLAVLR